MVAHSDIDHTGLTGVGVGDATAHISDTTDAHDASAISIVDTGTYFTATDVEGALQELGAGAGGSVATDSIWDAKGDLAVGTGANTASKLSAGTNGHVLTLDSGEATGMKWAAPSGGGGGGGVIEPDPEPDADDDEGTGADTDPISGWTTLGTLAVLDRDTTIPGHIYMQMASTGATRVDGVYKAHALADGEAFVAKLTGTIMRANYNRAGIFIGVATPGRIDTCDLFVNSNAESPYVEILAMTTPTSLSSQVTTTGQFSRTGPVYLAIRRNSATSYDYLWSFDGWFWRKAVSARDPSMTQATCGLFINDGAGSGTTMAAAFDWARFYSVIPGIVG